MSLLGLTFLAGGRLWLLALAPALVALYVWQQRRRRAYTVRFTNLALLASVAPKRPGWKRHVAAAMILASLILLGGAFARPARDVRVPRGRAAVVLVVDVSRSMLATDLSPNRMTAAKAAAQAFVDSVPAQMELGLVSFSNTAALAAPISRDRGLMRGAIDRLQPVAGTAMGEGLAVALDEITRVRESEGKTVPASVLLLSDGVSNLGRPPQQIAATAEQMAVPVYTVGVGTEGAVLQFNGQLVPVDVDEATLRQIAEATGAEYFRSADAKTLAGVYKSLGSVLGYDVEQREATAAAAGMAALILLGAAVVGTLTMQRIP